MKSVLVSRAARATFEMADNLEKWHLLSSPLEGRVHSMYLDILGLVTCGVGNLIDPIALALQLPWKVDHGAGKLATRQQVTEAWNDLKANKEQLKKLHWKYAAKRNDLRLTDEDIDSLVESKLAEFEAEMRKDFPGFSDFPADAQLGMCSMAWACGPRFGLKFKNFARFANAQDWLRARECCTIREEGNPGIVPRNVQNRICFDNAAAVLEYGLGLDAMYWPRSARLSSPPEPEMPADLVPEPPEDLMPLPLPDDWYSSLEELRKQDNLDMYDRWS